MREFSLVFCFLVGVDLLATAAFSYPTPVDFDGHLLRWNISKNDPPVTWEMVADDATTGEYYRLTIEESASLWSSIEGSYVQVAAAGEGEKANITIHLKNEIDGEEYSSGFSVFDASNSKGPTHCSITILAGPQEYGVGKTILHEFGHCLGLGHSLVPQAIMSYSLDENNFALDIDDKAVIARLYPANGSKPSLPMGCSVGGLITDSSANLILGLLVLPVMFGFVISRMHARIEKKATVA